MVFRCFDWSAGAADWLESGPNDKFALRTFGYLFRTR
jgi:hypothetical protein